MKKVIALVLTAAMVLSFTATAAVSADGGESVFVSSIEQKTTVEVSTVTEEDEAIVDEEGEAVEIDYSDLHIVSTAVSGDSSHSDEEKAQFTEEDQQKLSDAYDKLQDSYKELNEASSVTDVITGLPDLNVNSGETEADTNTEEGSDTQGSSTVKEDYVVSNLFDVTFAGTEAKTVEDTLDKGGSVKLTFNIGIEKGKKCYIATKCYDVWVVLSDEQVKNNGDGTITVLFYDFCPIAVIEVAEVAESGATTDTDANTTDATGGSSSPQTGDSIPLYAFGVVLFAGITGTIIIVLSKKNNKKSEK
ncbi:MAG: hypothetical protein LUI01_08450 [Firmicutes bacterium]|nr:hypothetical protein [Bacillota bacterium]